MTFDPNATGAADAGIFGLPFQFKDSRLILLPVPWEVTTSYGNGTSLGPASIYECSPQIDLFHADTGTVYEKGIYWDDSQSAKWKKWNDKLKPVAIKIKNQLENTGKLTAPLKKAVNEINKQGEKFHQEVYQTSKKILSQGKLLGMVGGDHSAPYGSIIATCEFHKRDLTVIHIDAHSDTRDAYQGYKHSHASIMRNVMENENAPKQLVQIGIRDFCQEEFDYTKNHKGIRTFYDREIKRKMAGGLSWHQICSEILSQIPTKKIYFSFDIDGLNPAMCPNTGTPVPGGIDYDEVLELFDFLVKNNKQIVGFDLNEVSPPSAKELDCWDGNVGSRVLYNLCCYTLFSND
jgi:agmatinase